jgi:hypothetical protein
VTRRIIWFATAYTIVVIVHEGSHAVTAYALGLEATLYNFWVNIDPTNQATIGQKAAFGVAGPASSLVVGIVAGLAYRRFRWSTAALPLLYLVAHGVSNFSGNLMSAAFIGDFSNVAVWTRLAMGLRYTVSAAGALATAAVLYLAGRELARWTAPQGSRSAVAFAGVVVPAAIGTALIVVGNQPIPLPHFAAARIGEAGFWVFAAAGAFMAPMPGARDSARDELRTHDIAIALLVFAVVRMLAFGIRLTP